MHLLDSWSKEKDGYWSIVCILILYLPHRIYAYTRNLCQKEFHVLSVTFGTLKICRTSFVVGIQAEWNQLLHNLFQLISSSYMEKHSNNDGSIETW